MKKYLPRILGACINTLAYLSPKKAAKIAMALFSTPRKGKINPEEANYLKAAVQDYVYFEDIAIQTYHWKGDNETILLVHGWESNTARWKDLITQLQALNYNIIALDAPAHGNSGGTYFNAIRYAECINLVVQKFKVSSIIGHSVGGMATVFFQYKYQLKSVTKLVLLGAPSNFSGVFNRYEAMMGYNKKVSKALSIYILKHFKHLPAYFSPSEFSKDITARGLVIHDKEDKIIPFNDGLQFKMNYKNSEFLATEGLGHGLKSDRIYTRILDFLKS